MIDKWKPAPNLGLTLVKVALTDLVVIFVMPSILLAGSNIFFYIHVLRIQHLNIVQYHAFSRDAEMPNMPHVKPCVLNETWLDQDDRVYLP